MESLLSPEVISLVISGAIALAGALFGNRVLKYKKTITEGFEAISVILEAFKDGKLTPDEAKRIQKEVQDVIKALSGNGK
uniref:Holin n=1 Tax=viral metagenome TaxID=1070528 RepID=A0A6H1ZHI9_9ZZZZ